MSAHVEFGSESNADALSIAFSPCPNDTFVFHAWVHGLVPNAPKVDVRYVDIDVTNGLAQRGELDLLKISYAALPYVLDEYALLPTGGALGHGCGPLLLVAGDEDTLRPDPAELAGKTVAVPSERSTAYLLFRMWADANVPGGSAGLGEIVVMPFRDIMPAVRAGAIHAGLVIHEARFTYRTFHLAKLVDLGEWWERETGAPIPLGAIVARRSLDVPRLTETLRASVEYAFAHREASRDYVLEHAGEMNLDVAESHIALYVNEFSRDLGEAGYAAIHTLLDRAADTGVVPRVSAEALAPVN
jgi:1,4-dihydroxy-6-naphthoate synthase